MNLATSGNFFYVENTNPINNQLALNSSVVLNCLGVNDWCVQNFDSFSTLTNLAVTGWLNDYKLGKKVYGWTLTPDSSTFPYTNSASLRDTNQEAIRQQYNNWIRTVPWPLSGYIEAAHAVDPNDNGYWNANNNYGDGVHPNAMGEAQIFTNMIPVFQQIAGAALGAALIWVTAARPPTRTLIFPPASPSMPLATCILRTLSTTESAKSPPTASSPPSREVAIPLAMG
jgi:hypothetical protein